MTKLLDLLSVFGISNQINLFILKFAADIAWAKSSPPLVRNSDWIETGTISSHQESIFAILTNGYSAVLKLIVEVDGEDNQIPCNFEDTMMRAGAQEGSEFILETENN